MSSKTGRLAGLGLLDYRKHGCLQKKLGEELLAQPKA